jgi:hypothetical protein
VTELSAELARKKAMLGATAPQGVPAVQQQLPPKIAQHTACRMKRVGRFKLECTLLCNGDALCEMCTCQQSLLQRGGAEA